MNTPFCRPRFPNTSSLLRPFVFPLPIGLPILFLCAVALSRSRPPQDLAPKASVLALYDSSEGTTAKRNPLATVIAPALEAMGLEVRFHDIHVEGLPRDEDLQGLRAVITGFLDGQMEDAFLYPDFLLRVLEKGARFVIIGNYGAYQERKNGEYVPHEVLNRAFEALGVRYRALWTSDPSEFSVKCLDEALRPRPSLNPGDIKHFYQFDPIRPDVKVLIEARRRNHEEPSAVVFTSATGAMALSRYLSPSDMLEDEGAFRFDVTAFLQRSLGYAPQGGVGVLVVYDPKSRDSVQAFKNLSVASAYTGINLWAVNLGEVRYLRPMDLQAWDGVVLALSRVPPDVGPFLAGILRVYLQGGGRIVSLLPLTEPNLARLLGNERPNPRPAKIKGIRFFSGGFPGLSGLEVEEKDVSFWAAEAQTHCKVMAEGKGENGPTPLWWRCDSGKGEVIALNASEFADRAFLGFTVQALLDATKTWAMPVLAGAVEFVDDCPLPMSGTAYQAMGGLKDSDFYLEEFFGMLEAAQRELNILPTFFAVFSYDERVEPPFPKPPLSDAFLALARRIAKADFAIGLHGLNHISPALSKGVTRPFPSERALEAWFGAAREAFKDVFGPTHILVFVPPNNYIDLAGKRALVKEVPEVRILSALFSGSEVETVQDFEWDPEVPGLLDFPRTWAGYLLRGEALLEMLNGLLAFGVSSHFIHPDDVLDEERSLGLPWEALKTGYLEGLKEVHSRFPFLRRMSLYEAATELSHLLGTGLSVQSKEKGVTLERAPGARWPLFVLVRLPRGCRPKVSEGESLVSDPESGRHFLRMDSRIMEVRCEE